MKKLIKLVLIMLALFVGLQARIQPSTQDVMNAFSRGGMTWWTFGIASGQVDGFSWIDKFGSNNLITTATDPEDVWEYGGLYTFSDTADIQSISSSSAADTGIVVRVQGLLDDGTQCSCYDTLNGQNIVTLDSTFWRVFRIENMDSVDLAGTVYCYRGTDETDGVPDTDSDVRASVSNGNNQTLMSIYTVPLGYVGFLVRGEVGLRYTGTPGDGTNFARLYYKSPRS